MDMEVMGLFICSNYFSYLLHGLEILLAFSRRELSSKIEPKKGAPLLKSRLEKGPWISISQTHLCHGKLDNLLNAHSV